MCFATAAAPPSSKSNNYLTRASPIRNESPALPARHPAAVAANSNFSSESPSTVKKLKTMACCDDPTKPKKIDRRDLIRCQERYDKLVRDLFTEDPEQVIFKLLSDTSSYLTELAALNAHHASVRLRAINLLEKPSSSVLERIINKEPDSVFGQAAKARMEQCGA